MIADGLTYEDYTVASLPNGMIIPEDMPMP